MKSKESVCVLYGGTSDERSISIRSGTAILEALKQSGVNAYGLDACNGFQSSLKTRPPTVAFIAIHGHGGEDGQIQRLLERLDIPYVGSNPKSSKIAFNKISSKVLFKKKNIPTPQWVVVSRKTLNSSLSKIKLPAVIKPACNGSSIGIKMVERQQQLKKYLENALEQYERVLVEEKIVGREFTVGILGQKALPVIELKPKRSFYDYKAKYTKGLTEYLVPAPISQSLSREIQRIALRANQALGLRDFSRVDVMVNRDGRVFVLEANSIPGFTETSLLPKAARASGISFNELCCQLVSYARKRIKDL